MATAAFTTVVDRSVGDPLTEAIWDDQIRDNLNALASAHRNLLTNGGFEVWQRGAGAFTTSVYSADRWLLSVGSGLTVTQETTTVDGSTSSLKAVAVGTVNTLWQKMEDLKQLRGKTLSFSLRVQQSVANGVKLRINDGSDHDGATSATTGSFVTLTLTQAISASATTLEIYVVFPLAGTYYLDNAMLVIGPAPAPYQPLHPQEDLGRCQRYYEVHGGLNNGSPSPTGWADAAAKYVSTSMTFAAVKAVAPTATKNGTWGVTACNQPTVAQVTTSTYLVYTTSTGAAALVTAFPNSTDDTLTFEANP